MQIFSCWVISLFYLKIYSIIFKNNTWKLVVLAHSWGFNPELSWQSPITIKIQFHYTNCVSGGGNTNPSIYSWQKFKFHIYMYKNQPSIINQGYCNEKIIVVKFSRFETPWQVELKLNGLSRTRWSTQTALSNAGTHTHTRVMLPWQVYLHQLVSEVTDI